MKPDIFVLDEPSSNLDAASIMDLRRIIAHWKEQGKTINYIGASPVLLRGLADGFIYMKEDDYSGLFSHQSLKSDRRKARRDGTAGLCSGKSPYARDVDIRKNHNGTS